MAGVIEHSVQLRVRYAETDQMRVAHHSNYVVWLEHARVELMRKLGFPYTAMEEQGYLMPVLELSVHYLRAVHFDELITVKARMTHMPRAKLEYEYEISNERDEIICRASTLHGFMNKEERAVKPPREFLQELKKKI